MNPRWHVAKIDVTPEGVRLVFVVGARRWVLIGLRETRRALNALGAPVCAYRVASVYYAILDRA